MAKNRDPYIELFRESMHEFARRTLQRVADGYDCGEHHFYITFSTTHENCRLPSHLRSAYPEEMTIVLQYQYWSVHVEEEGFAVTLSFRNKKENLFIPFSAISTFVDPHVDFVLSLRPERSRSPIKRTKSKPTTLASLKKPSTPPRTTRLHDGKNSTTPSQPSPAKPNPTKIRRNSKINVAKIGESRGSTKITALDSKKKTTHSTLHRSKHRRPSLSTDANADKNNVVKFDRFAKKTTQRPDSDEF